MVLTQVVRVSEELKSLLESEKVVAGETFHSVILRKAYRGATTTDGLL